MLKDLYTILKKARSVLSGLTTDPATKQYLQTQAPAGTLSSVESAIHQLNWAIPALKNSYNAGLMTYTVAVDGFSHEQLYGDMSLPQVISALQISYPGRVIAVQTTDNSSCVQITVLERLRNDLDKG